MSIPIRSILAATDLSAISNEVVRGAAALAALTGAELHVVHAVKPQSGPRGEGVLLMQRRIHDARVALRAAVRSAVPVDTELASVHVAFDHPATAILSRAEEVGADLIVIGPHRARPFGDQVLGSTADRLVRECAVPCLIVRRPLTMPLRRIVVPSDLSAVAQGALSTAVRWGSALQGTTPDGASGEIRVIHVETDYIANAPLGIRRTETRAEVALELDDAVRAVGADSPAHVTHELLRDTSPAEEILRYTRMNRVDLLVMGTRGDHPLVKTLLGSVSAAVTRSVEVPVLLVPPPVWKGERQRAEAEMLERESALLAAG